MVGYKIGDLHLRVDVILEDMRVRLDTLDRDYKFVKVDTLEVDQMKNELVLES